MIGAFTTTFDEVEWVRAIAPQLAVFDNAVVVGAATPIYWQLEGTPTPPHAELQAICDEFGLSFIACEDRRGGVAQFGAQRQAGMNYLKQLGCESAAWFAPDELFTIDNVKLLRDAMRAAPNILTLPFAFHTLWWNEHWEVAYWRPFTGLPISYSCFDQDTGAHDRHLAAHRDGPFNFAPVTCWHFAFARSDAEMHRKLHSWGHADSKELSEGHWRHWDEWEPGRSMFWPSANDPPIRVVDELPPELRSRLKTILPTLRRKYE